MRIYSVDFSQFLNSFYFQMWAKVLFVHNLLYLAQLSDGLVPLKTLCEPGAEFPDDLIQCGSCKNRYGSKINPDHFISCPDREHKYICSCDRFCGFHGDCCHDFQKFCLDENYIFQRISGEFPFHLDAADFGCFTFRNIVNIEPFNTGADPGFGQGGGPQLLRPKVADVAKRSRTSEASILRPGRPGPA